LQDFPLLDRGQVGLPGEAKSTITRDNVLAAMAKRTGSLSTVWSHRAMQARALGAIAYVPSEFALGGEEIEEGSKIHG
ncbi:restriction endonuclease, partial [Cronobacter sakazakii]|nr:restriction endonuclease [Cronobacter sakazakii]